jgi:hypothetical protein
VQLFGEDFALDPLFLEESWTLGIPAAAESLQRRGRNPADRERQSCASRDLDNLGSLFVIEVRDRAAGSLLADRATMIASRYASMRSERRAPTNAAPTCDMQQNWSSAAWTADDQIAYSWIQQGPMSEGAPRHDAASREAGSATETGDKMTIGHAHRLLGTITTSSLEEIRSAYRRKVSEWHPDRLQCASEPIRECATQQMVAINEAYRLLRAALFHHAA